MLKAITILLFFFVSIFVLRVYFSYKDYKSDATRDSEFLKMQKEHKSVNIVRPIDIYQQHQQGKTTNTQVPIKKRGTWDTLLATKYEQRNGLYYPIFDKEQKQLDEKDITIEGYLIPTTTSKGANYFLLSFFPYQTCYFCGLAGIQSLLEVETTQEVVYTDKLLKIKGIFVLNRNNDGNFFYKIMNAEVVNK
jgi:hypothetical protein